MFVGVSTNFIKSIEVIQLPSVLSLQSTHMSIDLVIIFFQRILCTIMLFYASRLPLPSSLHYKTHGGDIMFCIICTQVSNVNLFLRYTWQILFIKNYFSTANKSEVQIIRVIQILLTIFYSDSFTILKRNVFKFSYIMTKMYILYFHSKIANHIKSSIMLWYIMKNFSRSLQILYNNRNNHNNKHNVVLMLGKLKQQLSPFTKLSLILNYSDDLSYQFLC